MDELQLLIALHRPNARLGPGSEAMTRRAIELSGLRGRRSLQVADLGCGTGASALVLAEQLDAQVTAVDLYPAFLEELARRAAARGLSDRLTPLAAGFDALPFSPESLDAIWSEGAIYNLGFEAGITAWRPFLKAGGVLAVSELTWFTAERPAELQAHWDLAYPEVDRASAKLAALERRGYTPIAYFPLPESCWTEGYYRPLQDRFPALLAEHGDAPAARALVAAEEAEIALYERNKDYVGYGFYLARKVG